MLTLKRTEAGQRARLHRQYFVVVKLNLGRSAFEEQDYGFVNEFIVKSK